MATCDLKSAGWLKIRYWRLRVKDDWLRALRVMQLSSLLPVSLLFPFFSKEQKQETQEVTKHLVFTASLSLHPTQSPVEEHLHAIHVLCFRVKASYILSICHTGSLRLGLTASHVPCLCHGSIRLHYGSWVPCLSPSEGSNCSPITPHYGSHGCFH